MIHGCKLQLDMVLSHSTRASETTLQWQLLRTRSRALGFWVTTSLTLCLRQFLSPSLIKGTADAHLFPRSEAPNRREERGKAERPYSCQSAFLPLSPPTSSQGFSLIYVIIVKQVRVSLLTLLTQLVH